MIKFCDYIHTSTNFPSYHYTYNIDTGIYCAIDCEVRIIYQGTNAPVGRFAGFEPPDGVSDYQDFRLFDYSNGTLDVWSSRQMNIMPYPIISSGVNYDFTFGNFFVIDNLTETTVFSGTSTSMNTNCTIKVDVGGTRLSRLIIKNGGVVVFDGHAAVDDSNNTVGLYDTVNQQMVTNSNLDMTYDNILTLGVTPTAQTVTMTGGTFNLAVVSPSGSWSASTPSNWITLSKNSGATSEDITVTVSQNTIWAKTGTVTFTDGTNTATLTVNQAKNTLVPYNNLYRNGQNVN